MRPTALDDAHRIFVGWLLGVAWRRDWRCGCPACFGQASALLSADVKLRATVVTGRAPGTTAQPAAQERPS
ncbi:MAG: hypothetical protein ACYDC2_03245 [Solirubrobacteraceae bacterium]